MKRLALAAAAIAALASLTSCSGDSDSGDSAPKASSTPTESESASEEPTEEPTEDSTDGDAARFTTAYDQAAALFTELNATQPDAEVTNTEEANAAAGLDDTTPLVFADYSELEDGTGGSYCLQSDTGTYIAVSYADGAGEVDLGDGDCSYDTAAALVVGDLSADTWSVGAEYMGDKLPTGVFGS